MRLNRQLLALVVVVALGLSLAIVAVAGASMTASDSPGAANDTRSVELAVPAADPTERPEASETPEPSDTPEVGEPRDASDAPEAADADGAALTDAQVAADVAKLAAAGIPATATEFKALATKLGVGEVVRVFAFAHLSGTSTAAILAMIQGGQGWGEIAHTLGLHPGIGWIMSGHGNGHEKVQAKPTAAP